MFQDGLQELSLINPFGGQVWYAETLSSTMDTARDLAAQGKPHGTVIAADFQTAGRGRRGRSWSARRGENLFFTILLRYAGYAAIPAALTLRAGLAVGLAIEDFFLFLKDSSLKGKKILAEKDSSLKEKHFLAEKDSSLEKKDFLTEKVCFLEKKDFLAEKVSSLEKKDFSLEDKKSLEEKRKKEEKETVRIKWPNDIMLGGRKAAGILAEGDGQTVYLGIGVNVAQKEFPPELREKAVSIALFCGGGVFPEDRFILLEMILARLFESLSRACDWRTRLSERLYMQGKPVRFIPGAPNSPKVVEGILHGIGPSGELLLIPSGNTAPVSFTTGELDVYGKHAFF
ncbi:MAG: biotin--[acetyl-CoA-carboxylase] ligase family protein [Spirochaetaceae bacterium]|jgi:biotin-(acetyl-CoA carboxylase) ligase|nr:biotin--[acetyl-CoA-carboxylase] ligase family protein [Spirochaetaceae bacterium]